MKKNQRFAETQKSAGKRRSALDALDLDIMEHLIEDGRMSLTDMARELGTSVGTIRKRLARLLDEKVLMIFGQVDPNQIGFNAYAQIFLAIRPAIKIESVAAEISQLPEVSFIAQISGEFDLEVNVMCRDNEHLTQLMNEKILNIEGVHHTMTNMYLKMFKVAQPNLHLLYSPQNSD